jgi:hypothetical protein
VAFLESKVVTEDNCIEEGMGVGLGLNKEQIPVVKFFCWAL